MRDSEDAAAAPSLVACRSCDLLLEEPAPKPRSVVCCPRCGAVLFEEKDEHWLDRSIALSLTAAVFLVVANVYPFMIFELEGREQFCTIASGARVLWNEDMPGLALLTLTCTVLAPAIRVLGLLYLLLPLRFARAPWHGPLSYRVLEALRPWGMLEVYMLGAIVSMVKLMGMAQIELGIAFWAFCALMVTSIAASQAFDPRQLWAETRGAA